MFQHSMQNAYIGEVYEYSYDFRNKTLAGVQADWWSFPEWTDWVSFNSNGMYKSAWWYKRAEYPVDISTASKVTLIWHITKWYSDIDAWFWFRDIQGSYWLSCAITTGYSETLFRMDNWWSNYNFASYWAMAQWSYIITIIIDFVNKTIYFSYWTNSGTYSLSDTQVTTIRWSDVMWCWVCKNTNNYIPDISIKIE